MTIPAVFDPVALGPRTLRNRVVKAATSEGMTPCAVVTQQLIDFHTEIARGGVGMTTVAYLAVAPEGRTHREQIFLREAALPGLRRLTDSVHAEGAAVAAQIGHAGPVANGRSKRGARHRSLVDAQPAATAACRRSTPAPAACSTTPSRSRSPR